ncbi:putative transcription factor interactor and regulator CCHC(Zn) family [Helianthus annuus]|nr:putative transcription factor interactor and regulator CCHC(Zn) family [Helianthus annuus]
MATETKGDERRTTKKELDLAFQRVQALETDFETFKDDVKSLMGVWRHELTTLFKEEMSKLRNEVENSIRDCHRSFLDLEAKVKENKQVVVHSANTDLLTPRVEIPKPSPFLGKREARAVDDFVWEMEQYLGGVQIKDDATKIKTASMYLKDTAALWWRRRYTDITKGTCTINTWAEFVQELKKQFYPVNAEHEARSKLRKLKHTGTLKDYVKEFTTLVLEIPDLSEKDSLFYFLDGLQYWARTELDRRNVQDLATAIAIAESLIDLKEKRPIKPVVEEPDDDIGGGAKPSYTRRTEGPKPPRYNNNQSARRGCFICEGSHDARDCPKKSKLTALVRTEDDEAEGNEEARLGAMQLQVLNALSLTQRKPLKMVQDPSRKAKVSHSNGEPKGLRFVTLEINGEQAKALIDTGASHNFITRDEAKRLGLRITSKEGLMMKAVGGEPKSIEGVTYDAKAKIGTWKGKITFSVVPMDDYKIVLGLAFFNRSNAIPDAFLNTLYLIKDKEVHTAPMETDTKHRGKTLSVMQIVRTKKRPHKRHDEGVVNLGGGECHDPPKYKTFFASSGRFRNTKEVSRAARKFPEWPTSCWNFSTPSEHCRSALKGLEWATFKDDARII